jgi:hypothetical protein
MLVGHMFMQWQELVTGARLVGRYVFVALECFIIKADQKFAYF